MTNSKTFLIIISDDMRDSGSMLDYEIDIAEELKLPLIIAYTGTNKINIYDSFINKLPSKLRYKLQNNSFNAVHVPFRKEKIEEAIRDMNIHNHKEGNFLSYEM